MNNMIKRHLLPLAALVLASAACDPFPAKPGGDPAVVRTIAANGSHTASLDGAGGGTASNDQVWVDDAIYVHFNKPMDGTTIQKYPNYNSDGTRYLPPEVVPGAVPVVRFPICTPATNLVLSANFPADTTVCSNPTSPTDGGYMVVTPGDVLAYGQTYTITGTVNDYQGKALTLNVSFTVDKRPLPYTLDGYTTGVQWFASAATGYTVEFSLDGTSGWTAVPGAPVCAAGVCTLDHTERKTGTDYYYRITEIGGTGTLRPAALGPTTSASPLGVALTPVIALTPAPPHPTPGQVQLFWNEVTGASGYLVERGTVAGTYPTQIPVTGGATTDYLDLTTVSGTTYFYRVTPTFTSGFAADKGTAASIKTP